ncbi:hypothetical protein K3495_g1620 [Podosphaera aphanis]|nr:hypothetical protein K3495_g1620 [Podosphaera aphanis]
MRRPTAVFLVSIILILLYLLNLCSTLISLLFEDGAVDAILPEEIRVQDVNSVNNKTRLIPKIIHQTYVNDSIPIQWLKSQQSCLNLHGDYEYKLWTDVESRNFIASNYSWFLPTFDAYPYPIQRADVIRYFVLAHFGGIYIDLDDGCNRKLDPLLHFPAWLRRTLPTGISNDAMGSIPNHPFFLKTIKSLQTYQRNWGSPYISIMYSTGPLFLSVLWKEYLNDSTPLGERVRILLPSDYKGFRQSFFYIVKGSSWHGRDAQTIFWMGKHWLLLTVTGFALAGLIGSTLWILWNKILVRAGKSPTRWKGKERYELIDRIA